jgi:hypothetical protein
MSEKIKSEGPKEELIDKIDKVIDKIEGDLGSIELNTLIDNIELPKSVKRKSKPNKKNIKNIDKEALKPNIKPNKDKSKGNKKSNVDDDVIDLMETLLRDLYKSTDIDELDDSKTDLLIQLSKTYISFITNIIKTK